MTGPEVEELIMEMLDALEDAVEELLEISMAAAKAEYAYRSAHAREYTLCGEKTNDAKERYAVNATKALLKERRDAEAKVGPAEELCRTRRAQLEGLRSLIASARAAEYGRG